MEKKKRKRCTEHCWYGALCKLVLIASFLKKSTDRCNMACFPGTVQHHSITLISLICIKWGVFKLKRMFQCIYWLFKMAQKWQSGLINLLLCVYLGPLVNFFFIPYFSTLFPRFYSISLSIPVVPEALSNDSIINLTIEWWCSFS